MSGFFETSDGWVNVDHVMRIWHGVGKEAGVESYLELSDGRKVQVQVYSFVATPPLPAPAQAQTDVGPGFTAEDFPPAETPAPSLASLAPVEASPAP